MKIVIKICVVVLLLTWIFGFWQAYHEMKIQEKRHKVFEDNCKMTLSINNCYILSTEK